MTSLRLRPRPRPGRRPVAGPRPATPGPLLAVLLVALLLGGLARSAAAQPGNGTPQAISAAEINEFAERLGLTPAQRAAIDPIHDAYRADYERVRQQVIEPFLARQRQLNMGGPAVTREAVEGLLEDSERVITRVAALDARFFDQLVPLLTPRQVALLPRVRMARERVRSQAGGMSMMIAAGGTNDLSSVVAGTDLRLSPEEAQRVDEILAPYERRLTRRMSELDDRARSMMLRVVEAMDEAGFLGITPEEMAGDPERMEGMMETMQRAFEEAGADVREIAAEILELNVRTHERLMRTMPPPAAWDLRQAFFTQSLRPAAGLVVRPPSEPWRTAARIDDLDEGTREQVLAGLRAAMDAEQQVFGEVVERIVAVQSAMTPGDLGGFQEIVELVTETQAELAPRAGAAAERVAALLGEDWRDRARAAVESRDQPRAVAGMPVGGGGPAARVDAEREDADAADRTVGDPFVPARIGRRTLERMAARIGIAEEDQPILDALHADYVEAYESLPEIDAIRAAWRARWDREEGDELERARTLHTARRAARGAIAGLEATFFDDLDATFGDDGERSAAIERERLTRRFDRLVGTGRARSITARGGGDEGDVDLVQLVRTVDLSPADRRVASVVLAERLASAIELAERLLRSRLEMQVSEAEWRVAISRMDQSDPLAFQQVYADTMGAPSERLEAVRAELATVNRGTAEAIMAAVSEDGRRVVRDAWRRAAYPQVYVDSMCVLPHYERALALEDLDSSQREELSARLASYRAEWESLSEAMVEQLRSVRIDLSQWTGVDWNEVQTVEAELQRLGLARSDQSVRAANQLRLVLREDQLARLGGLPDPEDEQLPSLLQF